jgi:hypothetical protein
MESSYGRTRPKLEPYRPNPKLQNLKADFSLV